MGVHLDGGVACALDRRQGPHLYFLLYADVPVAVAVQLVAVEDAATRSSRTSGSKTRIGSASDASRAGSCGCCAAA
jgi:hypothetical protein